MKGKVNRMEFFEMLYWASVIGIIGSSYFTVYYWGKRSILWMLVTLICSVGIFFALEIFQGEYHEILGTKFIVFISLMLVGLFIALGTLLGFIARWFFKEPRTPETEPEPKSENPTPHQKKSREILRDIAALADPNKKKGPK